MNIQIQIQVCRACLKPPEATKLTTFTADSETMKNYLDLINIEVRVRFYYISITIFLF